MEIAKLLLQYLDVLIWPLVTIVVVAMFRSHFDTLLGRISEGKEFELEVGGQKLRIKTLEKGIEHVASASVESEPQQIKEEIELLQQVSRMPHMQLRLLAKFFGADQLERSELRAQYGEALVSLQHLGLLELVNAGQFIRLTPMGQKALEWMAEGN